MRVLVLGAYGLIGAAIVDRLVRDGHRVSGLGRDRSAIARGRRDVRWVREDLARLTSVAAWAPLLEDVECVVNAAGVLQDGARDRVAAVQRDTMLALYRACEACGVRRVVQISAVGAAPTAGTDFLRTKGDADAALTGSPFEWVILRPGLVIGPQAYGGTALLRALTSVPGVVPVLYGDRPVQTVALDEVADAAAQAVSGAVPHGTAADLVEDRARPLTDVLRCFRHWLGLPPVPVLAVPSLLAVPVAQVADLLGWLGWRSPLRSNAIAAVRDGILGDPSPWRGVAGRSLSPLDATLARLPATVQERWFARLWLLRPLVLAGLAGFWLLSGGIALVAIDRAADVLGPAGLSGAAAKAAVIAGAVADIALGALLLWRRSCRWALRGMLALSAGYLAAGTALTPGLWADPLGPLVKVLPIMVLVLVAQAIAEDR